MYKRLSETRFPSKDTYNFCTELKCSQICFQFCANVIRNRRES